MKKKQLYKLGIILFLACCLIILSTATTRVYETQKSLYTKIKLISTILDKINRDYVEEKDLDKLIDHAIEGMVASLDPHSAYLTADYFEKFHQNYEGYSGIGITFDIIHGKITVMSVFPDGPANKVGLLPGDRIIQIDGISAIGITREEAPQHLMGPAGTKVTITIERHQMEPKDLTIIRAKVHVNSVPYAFIIRPGIGYIRIIRFSATTGNDLEKALTKLESQGMKNLILDLRNNSGGYLNTAAEVVDKFLPGGKKIVYTKGRAKDSFREFYSSERTTHEILPLIILIDRISASASEIVAGSLQDWDRALILGETSFGKGLVQTQYPFSDGSALLITTARYYTPSGRIIQRPYNDKTIEEYYAEIINDSQRKRWENNSDRPVYKTQLLKRKIYGGGGITPDLFLKSKNDTLSDVIRELYYHPNRLFFTFVESHLANYPNFTTDFSDFLYNYQVNGNILQKFLTYIRQQNFSITDHEYVKNKKHIQFLLKQTIADEIWGDEARYKIILLQDNELIEALAFFPQAKLLIEKGYAYHTVE